MTRTTICLGAMAAVLMACGLRIGQAQTRGAGANDPMIPAPLLLNEDDHGATLDARVGQYVLIYLQDPYGGAYGWEVQAIQGEALKQMGRAEHVPGGWTPGQDTGRPAAACFRFAGVEEGQATVTLLCTPPPGLMVPVRFYEVTFNVRP